MSLPYQSWGRFPKSQQFPVFMDSRFADLPKIGRERSVLAYGAGRSYGDSCLNDGQNIIPTLGLDRFISFDRASGVLRCEAGVVLEDVLRLIVPQGWFLPVTPGTKFITVGGAVANDIHGKNHHCDGNFGHHVRVLELLRSSGERLRCSPHENSDFFYATVGGLGLTGFITWVEFQLKPIANAFITQEVLRFHNLQEFFHISRESEKDFTYTVSWVDCTAKGKELGRGLYMRGNHSNSFQFSDRDLKVSGKKTVPLDFPAWVLNSWSVKAFNELYFRKQLRDVSHSVIPYDPFFYPLDAIHHWNRIYGKRGFLQWQCVVPFQDGDEAIQEILRIISNSGYASFLAVLKTFGPIPSLGLLSFPKEGVTLALDFPNTGTKLFKVLDELDKIVRSVKGSIYPAKDARMSPESFHSFFPKLPEFLKYKDPAFSSSFWRRVSQTSTVEN